MTPIPVVPDDEGTFRSTATFGATWRESRVLTRPV
jgi:hypothetical protein